jgi:hypothetical protein
MRPALTARLLPAVLSTVIAMGASQAVEASGDRYRLELIVFRNVGVAATPVDIAKPRRFGEAFELDEPAMPEDPVRIDKQDGTFANIWSRLERLAEYEPLLRLTYEQSIFDFHPPVRVHGEEVLAEELRVDDWSAIQATIPGDSVGTATAGESTEETAALPTAQYFRLDGKVHLRRSRFLHVDMDLEYRLDGPAWQREFGLPPGFEWIGEGPEQARTPVPNPATEPETRSPAPINALQPMSKAGPALADGSTVPENQPREEPFRVHRLQQSRQIRTNTLQYFDSAFLGAIVRVTEIADEDT